LKHFASLKFWQLFHALPPAIQSLARKNYDVLTQNQSHPSLHFKSVANGKFHSVRIGLYYRALGIPIENGVLWFWIGSHADYDEKIG
jgi:hypothetical protein